MFLLILLKVNSKIGHDYYKPLTILDIKSPQRSEKKSSLLMKIDDF